MSVLFPSRSPSRFRRAIRQKLLVPLVRLRHHPELAARGTMVGLAWAFTPTFGIRMPLVFATWIVTRHLLRWDFSLFLGLAWTWVTNILVVVPVYFAFHVTGRLLLGRWDDLSGFATFRAQLEAFLAAGSLHERLGLALQEWGLTLWLGALPWSAAMAALGYVGARRFLAYRAARRRRRIPVT